MTPVSRKSHEIYNFIGLSGESCHIAFTRTHFDLKHKGRSRTGMPLTLGIVIGGLPMPATVVVPALTGAFFQVYATLCVPSAVSGLGTSTVGRTSSHRGRITISVGHFAAVAFCWR